MPQRAHDKLRTLRRSSEEIEKREHQVSEPCRNDKPRGVEDAIAPSVFSRQRDVTSQEASHEPIEPVPHEVADD